MKRSRKWEFVKQEAIRLAGLGLSDAAIGKRMELDRATVFRWRKAGKLGSATAARETFTAVMQARQTPEQWAASVRASYDLDVTDDQLVTSAESALMLVRDPLMSAPLRLQAMGRFQALVKQLALVARLADAGTGEKPARQTFSPPKRSSVDPREFLRAVK